MFHVVHQENLLRYPSGVIHIKPTAQGRNALTLEVFASDIFVPRRAVNTRFPEELIDRFVQSCGLTYALEMIARHEDPDYVQHDVHLQMHSYFHPSELVSARILDFGCGSGASTLAIASRYPDARVTGLELQEKLVRLADDVRRFLNVPNAEFRHSQVPDTLPRDLGLYDVVVLSAVYEHLLPSERLDLLPQIWSVLRPGGRVIITETPHRLSPLEGHSTMIWGINYMPDSLAQFIASRYSRIHRELNRHRTWTEHLRGGLRGGTERGIVRHLTGGHPERATILKPRFGPARSRAEAWLQACSPRHRPVKKVMAGLFAFTESLFDCVPALKINMVVQKLR